VFVTGSGLFDMELVLVVASLTRTFDIFSGIPLMFALVHQYRSARQQKNQRLIEVTRTLSIAAVGGLFLPLVANTLVRALGIEGGIAHQVTAIAVLIFGATTAMVLVRHNPLEIDRYAASVVGYVVTLGGLGGIYVMVLFTLPLILKRLGIANSSEALVAVTALIFASVGPVYRRLRKSVDKWFSLRQADAVQTAEVMRRVADSVQNDPRDQSLDTIVEAAMIIGPELVALWQIDSSGRSLHRVIRRMMCSSCPAQAPLSARSKGLAASKALRPIGFLPTCSKRCGNLSWRCRLIAPPPRSTSSSRVSAPFTSGPSARCRCPSRAPTRCCREGSTRCSRRASRTRRSIASTPPSASGRPSRRRPGARPSPRATR